MPMFATEFARVKLGTYTPSADSGGARLTFRRSGRYTNTSSVTL